MANILKGIAVFIVGAVVGGLIAGSFSAKDAAGGVYNQVQKYFYDGINVGTTNQFVVSKLGVLTSSATAAWSAAQTFTSTVQFGSSGTALTQIKKGTCTIFAYATTIAASSTGNVDCQAGVAALTSLGDVLKTDLVFIQMPTSTPTTSNGMQYYASASSTSGFISLRVINNTGTTFTWTSQASSSIPYIVIR